MDAPRVLQWTDLEVGDVLLHQAHGELAKLIAWASGGAYSHAAVVYDDTQLIEATAGGVQYAPLMQRATMGARFDYIDVFRPDRLQRPDRDDMLGSLRHALAPYVGQSQPMTSLQALGATCAVHNRIPHGRHLRRVICMALELLIDADPGGTVCSELVYRGFDEAATSPPRELCLPLVARSQERRPLPDIDQFALAHECLDDLRRAGRPPSLTTEIALLAAPMFGMHDVAAAAATNSSGDGDLELRLSQARERLGLAKPESGANGESHPPPHDLRPVLPADLEFSPGLVKIGRLALIAA